MFNKRAVPWPVRGVIAGFAGTAAMTAVYSYLHSRRPGAVGVPDADGLGGKAGLDYDDSAGAGADRREHPSLAIDYDDTGWRTDVGDSLVVRLGVRNCPRASAPSVSRTCPPPLYFWWGLDDDDVFDVP